MNLYDIYSISRAIYWIGVVSAFLTTVYIEGCIRKNNDFFLSDVFDYSKKTKLIISVMCHIVMIISLFFSSNFFMVKVLHSEDIRLQARGVYCYYVEATNENGNTYTLPARVIKGTKSNSFYEGCGVDEDYYVTNVYFKNGGYLYFETGNYFDYDKTEQYADQNDENWDIKKKQNIQWLVK